MKSKLTILTPTHNRANLLNNCYQSLCNQTCKDFEWLIIDDGSTDNTEDIVKDIIKKNKSFPIIYKKKENGGKHTALNYSHDYINGEYLIILDDDDILTNDAVEAIIEKCNQYKDNKRIWSLSFNRGDIEKKEPFVKWKEKEDIISNYIDFRINQSHQGDCAEVVKSDIFKTYLFPVFENEKFIGEDCLWITIATRYDTVYINKVVYLCEYLEGGLSKSGRKMRLNNPLGMMYRSNIYLTTKCISFKNKIKHIILYNVYAIKSKTKIDGIKNIFYIPALIVYRKWSR